MRDAARSFGFTRIAADGREEGIDRDVAEEMPIALEYQGIGYAVLMATPADLLDLAYGFSLSERLIDRADQILDIDLHQTPRGAILRVQLADDVVPRVTDRVRHRATDASCGLCGIENLEQAMRPLPKITAVSRASERDCFAALDALAAFQTLNRRTGAVHAAAACSAEGAPYLVREDVGRHNAFDKLIGAMLRSGKEWDGGFALLSSRCSYELVEKAVLAGCPMLATISAPTALALDRAAEAGLPLRVLVRSDALLVPRR
ncbi:formate dehydrogenase accessory sulfurtransferase FdhD [Sphingomonas vulcanisoli]|uniref:formate dehydrogenase accessory sulfurtransferase FdhD n=1 Tax=Sphingomonas vulcanisoli TaxID=1658060 RepID=UPI001FBB4A08|nr:formate dehydrogenase accessory sulfurtransferase FdhD [Sphingomonas vulcanisoli]